MSKKNETLRVLLLGDVILILMISILVFTSLCAFNFFTSFTPNHLILNTVIALSSFYASLCIMALFIPKLKPGTYPLKDPRVSIWFLGFIFARIWNYQLIRHPIFSIALLRIIFLKCLGSKISAGTTLSSDAAIFDPYLIEVEEGSTIGMGTYIVPHYVAKGNLVLAPIKIGKNVMVGAWTRVSPGVTIGDRTTLDAGVAIVPHVNIPKDCKIQIGAVIDRATILTEGCTIEAYFTSSKK